MTHEPRSGIDSGFFDIWGNWREPSQAALAAILASLGSSDQTPLNTMVVRVSAQPVRLAAESGAVPLTLLLEDGTSYHWNAEATGGSVEVPMALPLGYHRLRLNNQDLNLIICPDRAYLPESLENGQRLAGLALSLYGVRSGKTWGCGDFTALRDVIDWVAEKTGGSYIALNPLHAIHNRQPFNTSPYLPNSIFYRNLIYLDVDAVPEMSHSKWAMRLRNHPNTIQRIQSLNGSEFVEYESVQELKLLFLRILYREFRRREIEPQTPRAEAFRAWCEAEGVQLERFAVYMALDAAMHRRDAGVWIWPQWPEAYRDPASREVAAFAASHRGTVDFYKYVQWLLDGQACQAQEHAVAKGLEIGLFHDMPLAMDRCGFELWANREYFVAGCRVGSPPDDFSPKGQDWSFPPPNKYVHKARGYRLFAESIRKSARHGGALRMDHVMRLFRLYWIPDGCSATDGAYVRDFHEDLLGVLALESVRNRVLIVGEDLGTVEPSMREALRNTGILSYRLFYFERDASGGFHPAEQYPRQALVSSTTHDLPTLAGFWSGADIELRHQLGLIADADARREWLESRARDKRRMVETLVEGGFLRGEYAGVSESAELTGELHHAIMKFLLSTPSMLMSVNQEDLTKETWQQNLPATTYEYPNWRRKMQFSVEELHSNQQALDFAAMFKHLLAETGRGPA